MEKLRNLLKELCSLPSVSGREGLGADRLLEMARPLFDSAYTDGFGNIVLVKHASKQGAPKLMIDAHFDEVGMMVSALHDGGFLSVYPVGGLDTRVLPATEVTVLGKEKIYGVITSIPPHISGKKANVPKMEDIYIDTGLSRETLEGLVHVGDVIEFKDNFTCLANNRVASKSLDDKACVCAVLDMASRVEANRLNFDLYVTISAQEETGKNGARLVTYDIVPDIAIVTDVNFARGADIDESEAIELGAGASVDISALTNIKLTRNIMKLLDEQKIKYQRVCEPSRTSTNNDGISIIGEGVRTALMSIPLESMHTPSEVVSLSDIKSLSDILLAIAYAEEGTL